MKKIGNYEVLTKIGEGGMATVYKGRQISLNRPVAIKVLSKKLMEQPEIVERFNREALIIAKLTHPNIIQVIDRGVVDGMFYFIMNFIEGSDLTKIIKKGDYECNENVDLLIQICKALSYAHKNGIIHRDIKPGNILIDREGHAMVSDFGIAQLFDRSGGGDQLTNDGTIMGTLAYMSPEQKLNSKTVSSLTDIYSLGVMMYEMFTGVPPLGRFKPPSKINPGIPNKLDDIIFRCLETSPEDRFKSTDDIKDQLLEILQGAHINKAQKEQAFVGVRSLGDKFALLDIFKETNFGAVYLYEKKENKKLLVIKKIKNKKSGFSESMALSKLKHKNIIDIYGVSEDDYNFIVVMEYIHGGSLKDRLINTYTWRDAIKMCREICEGLSFIHENNIVHGNLRPSNLLLSENEEVKITDFGLDEHYPSREDKCNWYHPKGESKSCSADIFAVGVIFYQMLTGVIPSWHENKLTPNEKFKKLPLTLKMMITKMTSLKKEERYDNLYPVISMIDNILMPSTEDRKNYFLPVFIILLAVIIALFFFIL